MYSALESYRDQTSICRHPSDTVSGAECLTHIKVLWVKDPSERDLELTNITVG